MCISDDEKILESTLRLYARQVECFPSENCMKIIKSLFISSPQIPNVVESSHYSLCH